MITIFTIIKVIKQARGNLIYLCIEAIVPLAKSIQDKPYVVSDGAIESIFNFILSPNFDQYIPI